MGIWLRKCGPSTGIYENFCYGESQRELYSSCDGKTTLLILLKTEKIYKCKQNIIKSVNCHYY